VNKIILGVSIFFMSMPAISADLAVGKSLSKQCAVCHGKDGISRHPETPNLAGLSALYIEKALVDYKKGSRHDRRMSLIAQSMSKDDMKNLGAWYAAFKLTVEVPQI
jgi:cytochrome c553|tara:strand:- start:2685 stop:3005 length:321 start_codon:yes stop_codon:yes gene_type:complete